MADSCTTEWFGSRRRNSQLDPNHVYISLGVTLLVLVFQWRYRDATVEEIADRWPPWLRFGILVGIFITLLLLPGEDRAFIYFKF